MVDGIVLFRKLHHLIGLITFDFVEDLIEGQNFILLTCYAHGISVNEVNYFHIHPKMLDELRSLQDSVCVFVHVFVLLLHRFDL